MSRKEKREIIKERYKGIVRDINIISKEEILLMRKLIKVYISFNNFLNCQWSSQNQ